MISLCSYLRRVHRHSFPRRLINRISCIHIQFMRLRIDKSGSMLAHPIHRWTIDDVLSEYILLNGWFKSHIKRQLLRNRPFVPCLLEKPIELTLESHAIISFCFQCRRDLLDCLHLKLFLISDKWRKQRSLHWFFILSYCFINSNSPICCLWLAMKCSLQVLNLSAQHLRRHRLLSKAEIILE